MLAEQLTNTAVLLPLYFDIHVKIALIILLFRYKCYRGWIVLLFRYLTGVSQELYNHYFQYTSTVNTVHARNRQHTFRLLGQIILVQRQRLKYNLVKPFHFVMIRYPHTIFHKQGRKRLEHFFFTRNTK